MSNEAGGTPLYLLLAEGTDPLCRRESDCWLSPHFWRTKGGVLGVHAKVAVYCDTMRPRLYSRNRVLLTAHTLYFDTNPS